MAAKVSESAAESASTAALPHPPASAPPSRPEGEAPAGDRGVPRRGRFHRRPGDLRHLPTLSLAFDIGRCPQRAVSQEFLFVSHGHLDHIGGLPMYVATRGLFRLRPPTIFVPACLRDHVERLFEVHRAMDQSELKHNLVTARGWGGVPAQEGPQGQGFQDLPRHTQPGLCDILGEAEAQAGVHWPSWERNQAAEVYQFADHEYCVSTPEIAFTGDRTSDFILDPDNADVLGAKILVVESTFLDDSIPG
ncbi:hypothetical protein HU200_067333 [Digitaria exilis]|uniref:Metallo-beta-lactamase domain-containing protein n=1 Tax=Digitaria exilis TaxID=1010633 RepID=A0A834ZWW4_9POAL|nr:hypothetical protein HU200_067333 [Digitaria exilis]